MRDKISWIFALVLIAIVGLTYLAYWKNSPECQARRWLGVKLPEGGNEYKLWFRQAPGYYSSTLYLKFKASKSEFLKFTEHLGVTLEDGRKAQKLSNNVSMEKNLAGWWNPPEKQDELYSLKTELINIITLWHDGYVYLYKEGTFGCGTIWTVTGMPKKDDNN